MHRKGQVFSMPGQVSIGQDRNKKDPHGGRKRSSFGFSTKGLVDRNKKDPRRGRKLNFLRNVS